jgi:hypothetical protein
MICTVHNEKESDVRVMWYVWGRKEVHEKFWWEDVKERGKFGRLLEKGS